MGINNEGKAVWRYDGKEGASNAALAPPSVRTNSRRFMSAGWRRERMPEFPDAPWSELAPDWVCEVLSPGTRRIDLTAKRRIYGSAGVGHLWFADPTARTLEAFALRDGAWTLTAALKVDEEVRVAPFDAIAFPLSVLWPD